MDANEVACPLCGEVFADDDTYAFHLGEGHQLYDEGGTRTRVARAAANAAIDSAPVGPAEGSSSAVVATRANSFDPDRDDARYRPIVLLVGVTLVLALVGFAVSTHVNEGGDVASVAAAASGSDAPASPDLAAPTVAAPATTAAPAPTAAPTVPAATAPPSSPPSNSVDPPPAAEPAVVAPPTIVDASVDGCRKRGTQTTWTFSYELRAADGWHPAAAERGPSGRYVETRTTARKDGLEVTATDVVGPDGTVSSVALDPPLVAARCS